MSYTETNLKKYPQKQKIILEDNLYTTYSNYRTFF